MNGKSFDLVIYDELCLDHDQFAQQFVCNKKSGHDLLHAYFKEGRVVAEWSLELFHLYRNESVIDAQQRTEALRNAKPRPG